MAYVVLDISEFMIIRAVEFLRCRRTKPSIRNTNSMRNIYCLQTHLRTRHTWDISEQIRRRGVADLHQQLAMVIFFFPFGDVTDPVLMPITNMSR